MANWVVWFGLAGGLVILEMFSGTFYLLMIAFGLAAAGLAALSGVGFELQFAVAAVVGAVATYSLRRSRWGRLERHDAARDPNVNLDIGQSLVVNRWHEDGKTARVTYRGAMWDVELEQDGIPRPGEFVIREVRGNRLVVASAQKQ